MNKEFAKVHWNRITEEHCRNIKVPVTFKGMTVAFKQLFVNRTTSRHFESFLRRPKLGLKYWET